MDLFSKLWFIAAINCFPCRYKELAEIVKAKKAAALAASKKS